MLLSPEFHILEFFGLIHKFLQCPKMFVLVELSAKMTCQKCV